MLRPALVRLNPKVKKIDLDITAICAKSRSGFTQEYWQEVCPGSDVGKCSFYVSPPKLYSAVYL